MKNATMIATFSSLPGLMAGIKDFFPSKLILVVGRNESAENEFIGNETMLKKTFGSITDISRVEVEDEKDAYTVAKKVLELIGKEKGKGNEVILNVCEGSKTQPISLLLAAYAAGKSVRKILYTTLNRNEIVQIPRMGVKLSKSKKSLLLVIANNPGMNISRISRKIKKTRAIIYRHLNELEELGLVNDGYEITEAGRLVIG